MITKLILVALILIYPEPTFKTYDGGEITFTMPIYASKIEFKEDFTQFHDLKTGDQTWSSLGFSCNGDTTISITNSKKDKLFLELGSKSELDVFASIYIENLDKPNIVRGASEWNWGNDVLNIYAEDNSIVTIIWSPTPYTVEELLNDGRYIDAAVQAYTESIGPTIFYGLFLLAIAGAFIVRNQSFTPIVVFAVILFGLFMTVIPPNAFGLVLGVIILVGAAILYRLVVRERRT